MQISSVYKIASSFIKSREGLLEKLFRISELQDSIPLQLTSLAFFLSFIITFHGWVISTSSSLVCSPHISNCDFFRSFLVFPDYPYSYFQNYFFIAILGIIVAGLYALYKKEYENVWYSILILFLVKFLYIYVFGGGNYDYYDILLIAIFLFAHNKLYFLRIFYVFFYFLAATIKFHEGWTIGTYFTAMQTGIPIFPDFTTPIWTNLVILTQIFLCWGLIVHKKKYIFLAAEIFFLAFHFYSGLLVEYRYLLTTLPVMLVLYIIPDTVTYRKSGNYFAGLLALLMIIGQSIAIIIPGDQKLTLEGNKYGLYMFEANHQCVANVKITRTNGEINNWNYFSRIARDRCDPYSPYVRFKNFCQKEISSAMFTFDHSINGNPFYRIVDNVDICKVDYNPFSRNSWIKTELDNPEIIGYPLKNYYDGKASTNLDSPKIEGSLLILPGFERNDQITLYPIQKMLLPYNGILISIYWIMWVGMAIFIGFYLYKQINSLNNASKNKGEITVSLID